MSEFVQPGSPYVAVISDFVHRAGDVETHNASAAEAWLSGRRGQVTLDLSEDGAATFHMEPPAYLLHSVREGAGFVTHTAYVERYPGPYPFVLDADYPGAQD